MTARSVVVSVPTTLAEYIWPLLSVTRIFCAPEITWLLVTMSPSVLMIAPDPLATPLLSVAWMATTEPETCLATACQSGASPDLAVAEPEPDSLELIFAMELVVGTFTAPLVIAA